MANMPQGKKEVKSTKVPKSLFNQKKGRINDLMNQIGDDDDDEKSSDNKDYNLKNILNL